MQGGTKSFQKNANISLVLASIRHSGSISRIEIARKLGLNRSTISYIVSQLLERGIIYSESEGESAMQGGRKPIFLGINPGYGCVLGMEIQTLKCLAVVSDIGGNELLREEISLAPADGAFEEKFFYAFRIMEKRIEDLGLPLIGIGIGIPAQVNPFNGLIVKSFSHKLEDYDFVAHAASKIDVPVLIENDANCCALGELAAHRGKGPKNFLYILPKFRTKDKDYKKTGVTGIGMGIIIDENIYYGNNFSAGEFRSVFFDKRRHEQVGLSSEELISIDRDPAVLRELIRELCMNLSVILSVVNPGRIYIGGDLERHFGLFQQVIEADLPNSYVAMQSNGCEFKPADYHEYDVAAGAVSMFLERLFDIPKLKHTETYYSLEWETIFNRIDTIRAAGSRAIPR